MYIKVIIKMIDKHSQHTRSNNMSRVKSKNTQPELLVRRFLFSKGLKYRLYDKNLPGKPDIVLPKYNTIIFIHGCFWHGHENCKLSELPKTRTEFWFTKIQNNKIRDERNINQLKKIGWNVLIIYSCELKKDKRDITLSNVLEKIILNRKGNGQT